MKLYFYRPTYGTHNYVHEEYGVAPWEWTLWNEETIKNKNVKYNPINKTLSMDWTFAYGIMSPNANFTYVDKVPFKNAMNGYDEFPEDIMTIEGADYFMGHDKGSIFFFAVLNI